MSMLRLDSPSCAHPLLQRHVPHLNDTFRCKGLLESGTVKTAWVANAQHAAPQRGAAATNGTCCVVLQNGPPSSVSHSVFVTSLPSWPDQSGGEPDDAAADSLWGWAAGCVTEALELHCGDCAPSTVAFSGLPKHALAPLKAEMQRLGYTPAYVEHCYRSV